MRGGLERVEAFEYRVQSKAATKEAKQFVAGGGGCGSHKRQSIFRSSDSESIASAHTWFEEVGRQLAHTKGETGAGSEVLRAVPIRANAF